MPQATQKGNILLILVLVAAILVGIMIYYQSKSVNLPQTAYQKPSPVSQPVSTSSTGQIKTYNSRNLHFSLMFKSNPEIKDNGLAVDLIFPLGQISIVRNGTNFDNLESYITEFDSKRKLIVSNTKKFSINGFEALSRIVEFPEENAKQKSYYIYIKNAVYIISTQNESLFSDLDQIARSFRYTP